MTTQHLLLMIGVYAPLLAVVSCVTGATRRRIAGALAGGAAAGLFVCGAIVLAEHQGWWRVPLSWTPGYLLLFYLGLLVSCAPVHLITWRAARRFGGRGLAMCVAGAAVIGPPRDYTVAAFFPEWIVFAPGIAPLLAVGATYAGFVAVGHALMRLVAGPARKDEIASWPWDRRSAGRESK